MWNEENNYFLKILLIFWVDDHSVFKHQGSTLPYTADTTVYLHEILMGKAEVSAAKQVHFMQDSSIAKLFFMDGFIFSIL